jgi:hypothetical protein
MGVMGGYLLWSGMLSEGPQAITIVEQIVHRQMGPPGRQIIALAPDL